MTARWRDMHNVLLALVGLVACVGEEAITETGEGPPAQLMFIGPATTTGFAGNVAAAQPVRVLDAEGRPLAGVAVRFHVVGGGELAWVEALSDRDGYASPGGWRLGPDTGVQQLVAEVGELSAAMKVHVDVVPQPGFTIEFYFARTDGLLSQDQLSIVRARLRWEDLVLGDLPDMPMPSSLPSDCPDVAALRGKLIDDLLIIVTTARLEAASAGTTICARRSSSGLPAVVSIQLDPVKASIYEGIQQVMTHEIAHALGFGTIWAGPLLTTGGDPRFLGPSAVGAYHLALGAGNGVGVPVEATGGSAVSRAHWRESALLDELLTPFPDPTAQPLSAITVCALRDLGYIVDDTKADPFGSTLRP